MNLPVHVFPTRQYRYRKDAGAAGLQPPAFDLQAEAIYHFVMGRDTEPALLAIEDVRSLLHDPFAALVLGQGKSPQSLRELKQVLDEANALPEGLPEQRAFLAADGGQIPWSAATQDLNRELRFLIARSKADQEPSLFIATSSAFDSKETFLQVIGWDSQATAYQFYDRRDGAWVWAGSSWEALAPGSRGNGPFDSHVNGALNMKELKLPWPHWHSQSAAIRDTVLHPDDPLRREPIWLERGQHQAEDFEQIVRACVRRWTNARFARRTENGRLTALPEFLRQVLETSTVNLIASDKESRRLTAGGTLRLPITFFINADALSDLLPALNIAPPEAADAAYLECLQRFEVALADATHRFAGDTHFAFLVPEPAFEDVLVLEGLRERGLLSDKLAASLLIVDFTNPVFSPRRAALMRYIPDSATVGPGSDFAAGFIGAIEAAGVTAADSPEREFLANWRLPDDAWRAEFGARIEAFFAALQPRLVTFQGFEPIFRLVESRRREFRARPLAEFKLTIPTTNIPMDAPLLEFTAQAQVRAKAQTGVPIMPKFDPPGFLDDFNAEQAQAWSDWISSQFGEVRERDGAAEGLINYGPRLQFFNPLKLPPAADAVQADITWTAFPRIVRLTSATDLQRWRRADASRDRQDEYCEWSITRDAASGKITRVTFTSEGREYWEFLAAVNADKVLALYQQHVSPDVSREHLFSGSVYNIRNRWNNSTEDGAMHLVQVNNTLGAEIELAAAASIVRRRNGVIIDSQQELIECGRYGAAERHSDPTIGARVNELARQKADVTLANPVGLYLAGLSTVGWETPDGSNPSDYWRITRGTPEKALRAVYEVPAAKGFPVGDIKIGGRNIEFGAQIADFITIKLTGVATRIGQSTVAPFEGCVEQAPLLAPATVSVTAALGQRRPASRL